jgi:hypothetical protein
LGQFYANIHSLDFPAGELRGQVNALTGEKYVAQLTGRQEALPAPTLASGEAELELVGDRLIVSGGFENLSSPLNIQLAGGGHIHMGFAGQNGPVSIPLNISQGFNPAIGFIEADSNVYVLSPDQITSLQNRQLYINIHTLLYPGGELRGQILPEANAHYFVNLLGSNEVPSIMSMGSGAVAIEAYDDEIILSGSFQGLGSEFATDIAGGAHLHIGMAGENGPVDIPIFASENADMRSGVFEPRDNTYELDSSQMARLQNRGYYVNIHSEDQPAGELRGQVIPAETQIAFRAHLAGANEVPAVMSRGGGQIIGEYVDSTLKVHGRFDDLEDEVLVSLAGGLHIHAGFAGLNGQVVFPLTSEFDADTLGGTLAVDDNTFSLNSDLVTLNSSRAFYVNVHSQGHEDGEIRGQMLPESQIVFTGDLSSIFAVPNALSQGFGGLKAELNGNRLLLSGSFQGLSSVLDTNIAGGAHIHLGLAGSAGAINFNMNPVFPDDNLRQGLFLAQLNRFQLDTAQMMHLKARHYYANLHTEDFAAGELRAQLLPEADYYMTAPLSGVSQVLPKGAEEVSMPVKTPGAGMTILEIKGDQVTATGSFSELSAPVDTNIAGGAHLHRGLSGQNGPVTFLMDPTLTDGGTAGRFEANQNSWSFNAGQLDSLRERMFYVNVHSEDYAPGEIRGQVLGMARAYFQANLSGLNEVQPVVTGGNGTVELEFDGQNLRVTGAFAELNSKFNEEVLGGAHLHIGTAAENGGVDIPLNTWVSDDSLRGEFRLADNTYELDNSQVMNLYEEDYYVNIHSDELPSGEVRGQALQSINFYPMGAPAINTPSDGDSIILEGDVNTVATIDWDDAAVDENQVVYIWEVAVDSNFENTAIQLNVGTEDEVSITYGQLDTLLMSLGLGEGETAGVYHRVRASDGSVISNGPASIAFIKRNMLTDLTEAFKQNTNFSIHPTVTNDQVRIQAELPEAARSEIQIRNAMGQLVDRLPATQNGQHFEDQYIFSGQPQGMYLIQWIVEGEHVATERVLLK